MEKSLERVILEYLNENEYFSQKEFHEKIIGMKDEIEAYFEKENKWLRESLEEYKNIPKSEIEEEIKRFEEEKRKKFYKNIYSIYLPKVLNKNLILLEQFEKRPQRIVILKGKEAEFFVFIFNFYKNNYNNDIITKEFIDEAKEFLEIDENVLFELDKKQILKGKAEEGPFRSRISIKNRSNIYDSLEVENKIFLKITSLNINKNLKKLKEEMKEAEAKIVESNKKIEEAEAKIVESNRKIEKAEEKIKESNKKINKTVRSIENTKIDTLALLAIFVAIISIIYGNIFASNTQSIKNIVVTNVSTVACIAFILGYIEIFIKDNKIMKKEYFISATMIIVALALIVSAYYD